MNKIEKWFLEKIAKKLAIQGNHKERITEYYRVMQEAARKEFPEDNWITLNDFLRECHEQAALPSYPAPKNTIHIVFET